MPIMNIDWFFELQITLKLIISFAIGGVIGWERERTGHEAGIRTFGLISLGSCAFGLVSIYIGSSDHGRIAAQVVSGIGFICTGVIFRENGSIKGLTTAATLWCTAAVGLAVALDMYVISLLSAVIILVFLSLRHTRLWSKISGKDTE